MTSATVGAIDIVAWFVYLFSAVLFVVGLHFMNSPKTARKGNQISAFGMVVADRKSTRLNSSHRL